MSLHISILEKYVIIQVRKCNKAKLTLSLRKLTVSGKDKSLKSLSNFLTTFTERCVCNQFNFDAPFLPLFILFKFLMR